METPNLCREIFAAMSDRRVTNPSQIVEKLKFVTTDRNLTDLHMLMKQCFRLRLIRWLYGRGHPLQLKGIHVPDAIFDAEREDPLVRSKLLLKSMTRSDLLLVEAIFLMTVSCDSSHHGSPLIPLISSC